MTIATNISPYLVDGSDFAIINRSKPLCDSPDMGWGNKPVDGGYLILDAEERKLALIEEPTLEPYIRPFLSGGDFINGDMRFCFWLVEASPSLLHSSPILKKRLKSVHDYRLASTKESTRKKSSIPALFAEIRQPKSGYLAIPEVSSERRTYIPMAYLGKEFICSNKIQFVPNASRWHFGILTSAIHMAWMRQVGGRLKSDFSYSSTLVYNNYPWPQESKGQS